MAFAKRQNIGRVYVIKLVLPGDTIVWKIGMVHSARSLDRMMEILRSWFSRYRFVPYAELRLDLECGNPLELEKHIHKILHKHQFIPSEKVEGGTEMFTDINEFRVLHYLRQFDVRNFDGPLMLTEADYDALCRLISP